MYTEAHRVRMPGAVGKPGRNPAVPKPIKTANYYVGCPMERMDGGDVIDSRPIFQANFCPRRRPLRPILGLFWVYFGEVGKQISR